MLTGVFATRTPDSSRFWPAADYAPGRDQKSFDSKKGTADLVINLLICRFSEQYLRDWLTSQGLKGKEGVSVYIEPFPYNSTEVAIANHLIQMTEDVAAHTSAKYLEAFQRLTGETLDQALAKLE